MSAITPLIVLSSLVTDKMFHAGNEKLTAPSVLRALRVNSGISGIVLFTTVTGQYLRREMGSSGRGILGQVVKRDDNVGGKPHDLSSLGNHLMLPGRSDHFAVTQV